MSLTNGIWRRILQPVMTLSFVVIMMMIPTLYKNVTLVEENKLLLQKIPKGVSMTFLSKKKTNKIGAQRLDSAKIKILAKLINNAKKHARGSKTSAYLALAVSVIDKLLENMNVTQESVYSRATKEPIHVCPERFKGANFGFPLYYSGFETTNCRHSVRLSKIITIVKYVKFNLSDISVEAVNKFLSSVFLTLPGVRVLLATNSQRLTTLLQAQHRDTDIFFVENMSEGNALNTMISQVKTVYVMIARNVEFFTNDSRLQRLIGEIESLDIKIAGGSFRNKNGHWTKGCFQVLYRNFTLKYYDGYDESLHECLFCDFITGPFVSTTIFFVKQKFDDLNDNNGLYEDFFLRIFQKGEESIVCPDSMFHIDSTNQPTSKWKYFMKKWMLNKIVSSNGLNIYFNYDFKPPIGKRFSFMDLSKLQKASDAVKVSMLACLEAGVVCELEDGTALGAIKMGKTLPWDIDFDIRFLSNNCSQCRRLVDVFRKRNIHFKNSFINSCCTKILKLRESNYVGIQFNGSNGDFSGFSILDSALLIDEGIEPTKALFDGLWLNVPRNPGLSMRNRYGREIYQHAEHWRFTGGNSTNGKFRMNYTTNVFLPCASAGSHGCLDRFNADGTLQFFHLLP